MELSFKAVVGKGEREAARKDVGLQVEGGRLLGASENFNGMKGVQLSTDIIAILQGHLLHIADQFSHPGLHPFYLLYPKERFHCLSETKARNSRKRGGKAQLFEDFGAVLDSYTNIV